MSLPTQVQVKSPQGHLFRLQLVMVGGSMSVLANHQCSQRPCSLPPPEARITRRSKQNMHHLLASRCICCSCDLPFCSGVFEQILNGVITTTIVQKYDNTHRAASWWWPSSHETLASWVRVFDDVQDGI